MTPETETAIDTALAALNLPWSQRRKVRAAAIDLADRPGAPGNADRLWEILDDYECWPGFRLVGVDGEHAAWLVVQLGDMLRRLLNAGEREFSRLTDELQFVRLYLELQQKRFADRLTVWITDVDGLPSLWVPSLILQPLVENAVVHGLARHTGPVVIRVEGDNKAGLAHRLTHEWALAGISFQGLTMAVVNERFIGYAAFDNSADANKAATILANLGSQGR